MRGGQHTTIRELLLGDNPFIGVSHLGQAKAREEKEKSSLQNRVEVIESAIGGGATGFTFTTHEANLELLTHLSDHRRDLLDALNYYILAPYMQLYVRKANIEGTPAFIMSKMIDMLHKPLAILDVLTSLILLKPGRVVGPLFEIELAPFLEILPKERIKAVFLHEVLTELVTAFHLKDLLTFLINHVRDRVGVGFGLETRNLGHLHRWMSMADCYPEYLMMPLNPLGYQMAPSKEATERSIRELSEKTKIVAINVLASGAVNLEEAMNYLAEYEENLYAVTAASVNPHRTHQNFSKLSQMLSSDRASQHVLRSDGKP